MSFILRENPDENLVHTLRLSVGWDLIDRISLIDRFDAAWQAVERREGARLQHLRYVATVNSVGASTRIEGSKLSDAEVDVLLRNITVKSFTDRDTQEVAGYYEVMDLMAASYPDIDITEGNIKNLHNLLLKYADKDQWHRGRYKQQSNVVEAAYPDGTRRVIFETTPPGFPTDDAMFALVDWYAGDRRTHALVKCAVFAYEFLSIHPFQDGNGRLSRLLTGLLLLQNGYRWIQYVSFEHEIERRKTEYYRVLRLCQSGRPNEDVTAWVQFFLDALGAVTRTLMQKLEAGGMDSPLTVRAQQVLQLVANHPGIRSGELSKRLDIPGTTVKKMLADLVEKQLITRRGSGAGTHYLPA